MSDISYRTCMCCVCKKKPIKYKTINLYSLNYGFCSKVCIANNTIKSMKLEKLK